MNKRFIVTTMSAVVLATSLLHIPTSSAVTQMYIDHITTDLAKKDYKKLSHLLKMADLSPQEALQKIQEIVEHMLCDEHLDSTQKIEAIINDIYADQKRLAPANQHGMYDKHRAIMLAKCDSMFAERALLKDQEADFATLVVDQANEVLLVSPARTILDALYPLQNDHRKMERIRKDLPEWLLERVAQNNQAKYAECKKLYETDKNAFREIVEQAGQKIIHANTDDLAQLKTQILDFINFLRQPIDDFNSIDNKTKMIKATTFFNQAKNRLIQVLFIHPFFEEIEAWLQNPATQHAANREGIIEICNLIHSMSLDRTSQEATIATNLFGESVAHAAVNFIANASQPQTEEVTASEDQEEEDQEEEDQEEEDQEEEVMEHRGFWSFFQ